MNGKRLHIKKKKKHVPYQEHIQPIYYWVVMDHNLCDTGQEQSHLYFTDPDANQIENLDQNNYIAIDKDHQLHLIHLHLRHKGMKMTPTYFIARNV